MTTSGTIEVYYHLGGGRPIIYEYNGEPFDTRCYVELDERRVVSTGVPLQAGRISTNGISTYWFELIHDEEHTPQNYATFGKFRDANYHLVDGCDGYIDFDGPYIIKDGGSGEGGQTAQTSSTTIAIM